MRLLIATVQKEFKQLIRDRLLLFLVVVCPVIVLATVPHSFEGNKRFNIAFCDLEGGHNLSTPLKRLSTNRNFKSLNFYTSFSKAEEAMDSGGADLIVVNDSYGINYLLDGTTPAHSLNALFITLEVLSQKEGGERSTFELLPPQFNIVYNESSSYKQYSLVSLIILIIVFIGAALFTLNLVNERENGLEEQFRATAVNPLIYRVGKYIYFTLLSLIVIHLSLLICHLLYGLKLQGTLLDYIIFNTLFLFPLLGLTFLISSFCKTQLKAVYLLTFVLLPLTMLSTMFSHLSSMPRWAALLRYINPIYFGVEGSRQIIFKGAVLGDMVWDNIFPMLLLGLFLHSFAVFNFRRA